MRELIALLSLQERKMASLYDHLAQETARVFGGGLRGKNLSEAELKRALKNNKALEEKLKGVFERFRKRYMLLLSLSMQKAWDLSHRWTNGLISERLKLEDKGFLSYPKRLDLSQSAGLSERIWELSRQNGRLIKVYLSHGISSGVSSVQMAQELKKHLKEPDRLFRRLKKQGGGLKLSQAARGYHPGRGVYRSSFKNALRLARTEVNMAYHRAEHHRWVKLPFVLGIEVRLSKAHKEGSCLCDHLKGKYPKSFLFLGWHPQCLCQAVPILLSRDEFIQYSREGKIDPGSYIQEAPEEAIKYLNSHADKLRALRNPAYFIKDNYKYVEGEGFKLKATWEAS